MERTKVPHSAIAHIIGQGGANIKDLQNRSGATCRVQGNYVEVTGSPDARRLASNLIKDCVDNFISVYNHPLEAIIALRQPFIGLKSVKFVKYQGIVDEYNVNKAYFVLDKGEEIDHKTISSPLRSSNIREIIKPDIIAPEGDDALILHITKRLIEETKKSPDKELKVRMNLGKQLFYPAKKGVMNLPTHVPLDRLIKYKIGYKADVKTTFMNHLSVDIVKVIESHLKKLGYEESNSTQRVSIHAIDVKEKRRITISNDITSEGHLKLRKCQPDNASHLLLSFVRPKSTLDFRLKVLSHKESIKTVPSEINRIIDNSICNFDAKTVTLPDSTEYRVTIIRLKIKHKFVNNTGNKVTISNVYETGKMDVQVTVTNPRLREVLSKMKNKETSTGEKNERELEEELEKEAENYVKEMNRIVDGVQLDELQQAQ